MKAHGLMPEHLGKMVMFVNPDENPKVYYIMGTLEFARGVGDKVEVRFVGSKLHHIINLDWDMILKEHF